MFKQLLQSLFNCMGYTLTCNARFGREPWQDLKALVDPSLQLVVFDVGAHRGQTLLGIKQTFPTASVHCFEPDPETFAILEKTAKAFPDVTFHQMALGDEAGQIQFNRNRESMTNSLLATSPEAASELGELMTTKEQITVPVGRLDDFCSHHSIGHIHLLKTDCQGFDLRVLKGAERLLSEKRIDLILCEAIFDSQYVGQGWFHEILSFLSLHGYAFCGLYHPARNSRQEVTFADAIFRRRK